MRRSSNLRGILVVFGFLLAGGTASAQDQAPSSPPPLPPPPQARFESPPPQPPAVPSPPRSGSYAAQIVLTDLGAVLVGALASGRPNNPVPFLFAWSLASPVVHVVHRHPGRALLSLLFHVGIPIAGVVIGAEAWCHNSSDYDACGVKGLVLGALAGMVAATTLDAAILARLPDQPPSLPPAYGRGIASVPALSVNPRGDLTVGWRGTF